MERYYQIGKVNLKYNLYPHLLLSVLLLFLSPFLMGVENLDAIKTARVLEMYVALIGIILLTPVFLPEQNKEIRDLTEAKYVSATYVTIIRVLEAVICLSILIAADILILVKNNCVFSVTYYFLGTLAEAFFLGAMGLFTYAVFDQIAIAYMLPLMYYILCFGAGGKYLKNFYLFSMQSGSYREKVYLAVAGGILLLAGITYPYIVRKIVPKLLK